MRKFGLIGKSLKHSFSKRYFDEKFKREGIKNCSYELFEVNDIFKLRDFILSDPSLIGLNVTVPYKEAVLPLLDRTDEEAMSIEAVNVIKITRIKKLLLEGFNTDSLAFQNSLESHLDSSYKRALILGTGGAAKAVAFALKKLGISYLFVSRNQKKGRITYAELNEEIIDSHQIIVNATSRGTFPDITASPKIPYHLLSRKHLLYDLVYNPGETEFLRKGKEKGAKTMNGLRMLEFQAEGSWKIWNS